MGAAETELSTDFALLFVGQADWGPDSGVYASSDIGAVSMRCGHKYSRLHVRVEHWDQRPPQADDDWEDCDVLPWAPVGDGGALAVNTGDGPVPFERFDLSGLARGRVEVLSAGRHRYYYGSHVDVDVPRPERWLLRFWPDPEARDAMAGPPRRLAGREWLPPRRTGWDAALHGWEATGWKSHLSGVLGFDTVIWAATRAGKPFARDDLLPLYGNGSLPNIRGPHTWETPVEGVGWGIPPFEAEPGLREHLDRLADVSGMARIETFGDAFDAMVSLGLFAVVKVAGDELYVPSPVPPLTAWDAFSIPDVRGWSIRAHALADYRTLAEDVQHLQRWAPERVLTATPRRIALRLAVPVQDVIGALRLLGQLGTPITIPLDELSEDKLISLGRG